MGDDNVVLGSKIVLRRFNKTFYIEKDASIEIMIRKNTISAAVPGMDEEDNEGGAYVMNLGGTERILSINFLITGSTFDDIVSQLNELYSWLSGLSIGDIVVVTFEPWITDEEWSVYQSGGSKPLWYEFSAVFSDARLSQEAGKNVVRCSLRFIIGTAIS